MAKKHDSVQTVNASVKKATSKGKRQSTAEPPAVKLRKSGKGLRRPADECTGKFTDHFEALKDMAEKLVPFSTSCESLGLDAQRVGEWVARYPAIRTELKRARAAGLIALQAKVAAGSQGWQALMRLAESADPDNWIRPTATGRKANDRSPYVAAMRRK